jgi:acetyltransferase-like isoleucine patch superfamily enzyme
MRKSTYFDLQVTDSGIGHNVIVMAGSLETQDVPDNVAVGGTPARLAKRVN